MTTDDFTTLIPLVERILNDSLGGAVRIETIHRISEPERRNQLLRCRLAGGPTGAPESVMVKRRHPADYDPDKHTSGATRGLFRDWAGLEFLTAVGSELVGSPRFYGGDRAAGLIVMEDLGAPEGLHDLLLKGTADEAERGLLLLAKSLGRMHGATIGREEDYRRIRGALGPGDGPEERKENAGEMRQSGAALLEHCGGVGATPPAGVGRDIETIARSVADPGPFLAYTHGDPCPDNTAVALGAGAAADSFRLIDFEVGAYRHALRDGIYGRIRFPTCWCVRDLPEPVIERMDAVYRAELVKGCPEAADDAVYLRAVTEACGAWLLLTVGWSLPRALDFDPVWGVATHRQRLLMRLPAFVALARRAGHLEALGELAEGLHRALAGRWERATAPIAVYPAFARETPPPPERVAALVEAIERGDVDGAVVLLEETPSLADAHAGDEAWTPLLQVAIRRGDVSLVRLLLDRGADWRVTSHSAIAGSGVSAFTVAAREAPAEIVALLLERGADPNGRGADGYLAIHHAARRGAHDVVRLLLDRGADVDVLAAVYLDRSEEVPRLAVERPDQVTYRFPDRSTPLHHAAGHSDAAARCVPLLVEHGADVAATTWRGDTPLHNAAREGHLDVARALLAAGADPNAKNRDGDTPLRLAESGGHTELAALLRQRAPAGVG